MLSNFYVMKRNLNIFLFTIFYLLGSTGFSQVNVTFKVDMQYQTVSENGVYIAGSMQDWSPGSTPLSDDDGNGIWEVTLSIAEYTSYEYKFINGNTWEGARLLSKSLMLLTNSITLLLNAK